LAKSSQLTFGRSSSNAIGRFRDRGDSVGIEIHDEGRIALGQIAHASRIGQ
jgi:hypothetical protein